MGKKSNLSVPQRRDVVLMLLRREEPAVKLPAPKTNELPVMCSPRHVLLEARRDISGRRQSKPFWERIRRAQREHRKRTSAKQKRQWPRRKPHKPPHPSVLLKLTTLQKLKLQQHLLVA